MEQDESGLGLGKHTESSQNFPGFMEPILTALLSTLMVLHRQA